MKAVNLIPEGERRGAGGAAGRTGGASYILIGALALIVLMLAAYATTSKSVNDQQAKLADVEAKAAASEAEAAKLAPYTAFATIRSTRVDTVTSIAGSRFDWAHAMHEVGRTLPRDITLTNMTGSVAPGAGGGGGSVALRSAYNAPAIEFTGCAPSQASIPPMLASMRRIDGVRRVALQQSVKDGGGGASSTPQTSTTGEAVKAPDCSRTFQAVVFFDPRPAVAAPAAATPTDAGAAAGTTQPVSGGAK